MATRAIRTSDLSNLAIALGDLADEAENESTSSYEEQAYNEGRAMAYLIAKDLVNDIIVQRAIAIA